MLPRSSATVEPMRSAARRSGPAAYVHAAASASRLATTSGITTISQIRSMSGAESPVPARDRGPRIRNPLRGKRIPSVELLDPARRTMLVAPDNRCFGAFWCVHFDQAGLLAFAVVVHPAGVADCDRGPQTATGRVPSLGHPIDSRTAESHGNNS